jgi:hypothetical protein
VILETWSSGTIRAVDGWVAAPYAFIMKKKEFKIGVFIRDAILLAFGFAWFAFLIAAITSPPPTADCTGKSTAECEALQKKIKDDHQRDLNTLLLNMG